MEPYKVLMHGKTFQKAKSYLKDLAAEKTTPGSGDDFSDCDLFSFVAWDHVSWPGNDFYIGSRATDDGVKAAATDSMAVLTGVKGTYNAQTNKYDPPGEYGNWNQVIQKKQLQINVKENLCVLPGASKPKIFF